MENRTEAEIIVDILRSAFGASTASTIINGCSITDEQLGKYLHHLVENCLLEYIRETDSYRITPRGVHVMSVYEQFETESRRGSIA